MNNDRKRPFLEEPAYHGCPVTSSEQYFQRKVEEFRKDNKEFDLFLEGIKQEIIKRKINYCDNILLLINGNAKTNWVSPKKSLFRTLIKLYNYDFSPRQAVDHIELCYSKYQTLLSDELEMSNEYEVFTKRISWDSSSKDFVNLVLSPKRKDLLTLEPYFIRVTFCTFQSNKKDCPYSNTLGDENKIDLVADESTYEDSLCLFDYYNGNRFSKKIIDITIKELIRNKIIDEEPDEVISGLTKEHFLLYSLNINRHCKIKKEKEAK